MQQTKHLAIFAGLLLLAGLIIYWPGLSGPLFFDDKPALTANERVQIDGATFDQWRVAALSSNSGPLRRPIAMVSFAANYVVVGDFSPFGLKSVNLVIHLLIAALLYSLSLAILTALGTVSDDSSRRLVALFAAGIWLLHPLNVSTVLYAVQRMAQLSTLFVMVGLLVFVRYRQRWAELGASSGEMAAAALWMLLLMILAVLSKENGALLPWLVVVVEVCVFRGVWAGRPRKFLGLAGWAFLFLPLVLMFIVVLFSPEQLLGGYARREFTLEERLLTQSRMLWHYLGWVCLPNIVAMGFQHDDIPISTALFAPWSTFVSLIAWSILLLGAILLKNRYPLLLLASLFFLVGQAVESSILPLEMAYEHRNYLPSVMVCLTLAALIVIPVVRSRRVNVWYPVLGVVIILSLMLSIRVHTWSDAITLGRVNLAHHPDSPRTHYIYANALFKQYQLGEASGLTETERGERLLLARHYFERMSQADKRDFAPLVMLFYLDNYYFTKLKDGRGWLAQLEALVGRKTLQPSDRNALATLFEILSSDPGLVQESRVINLLDSLERSYPRHTPILRYRYQYLTALSRDSSEKIALLQRARTLAPKAYWVYYGLMLEYARNNNVAGIYDVAGLWLFHDRPRYHLHQLKTLFAPAQQQFEPAPNESHEN